MTLTRDSLLLWLAIAGTIVGYFAAADKPPNLWNFHEWMQFGVMLIAFLMGKLQVSPLPSRREVNRDNLNKAMDESVKHVPFQPRGDQP